ncbi:MAG: YolD-like family protein [Lachnospiraceae bacterium]
MENKREESYYIRPQPKKKRPKMERAMRAKQFMPFAALKGYSQALAKKEKIVVEKIELSEERAEVLDRKMHKIKKNQIVTVIYFFKGEYLKYTGMVSNIDPAGRTLKIVQNVIPFDDIYEISIEEHAGDGA